MNKILRSLTIASPLLLFLILVVFFWLGLHQDPHHLPSALINQPAPTFHARSLLGHKNISDQLFKDHVTLLSVFASDCYPCMNEHQFLMQLRSNGQLKNLQIIGINYKDQPQQARLMLKKMGNPYSSVIADQDGSIAMNFGVYGTPETFIIDRFGVIRYRHVGVLSASLWQKELLPIINREVAL